MSETNMLVLQPFHMQIVPIKKLALLNFEKKPDEIYAGLELQYLETEQEGEGFRVIAYRRDHYVDVYDENCLNIKNVGKFEVCQEGLKHYRKVDYKTKCFELTSEGIHIEFSFADYKGRAIDVRIIEHGKKPSIPFDLLAPIGVSSKHPVMFPAYCLYQFDFIRKKKTEVSVFVNGKSKSLDPFPVFLPKDGQFRYFSRYGYECQLVEMMRESTQILPVHTLDEQNQVHNDGLVATYEESDGTYLMKSFTFETSKHVFVFEFDELFPDLFQFKEEDRFTGFFNITMDSTMGKITGRYEIIRDKDIVEIVMNPIGGWDVEVHTMLTSMLLSKKSTFCTWPKSYRYHQTINLITRESSCRWERV